MVSVSIHKPYAIHVSPRYLGFQQGDEALPIEKL
jgi:hypothetical protein